MRLFAAQATAHPAVTRKALHWLLRILLGTLILATGAGKALDVPGFAEVIRTYRLGWADDFLLPMGFGIAGLELTLGMWLLAGWRLVGAARVSISLNAGYCLLLTSALWRGLDLDNCGCFGVYLASPLRWYSPLESLALAGLSYLLLRGARMCSRGSAQGDPQAMGLVKSLLMRAFARPTGLLGRLGGTIMARMNRRIARRAIQLLDVRPDDRVLEVGFGPGVGIALLASATPSGWVAGIDPSEEMLTQARVRNANAVRTGRVELLRGSVEGLPFENSAFSKAVAINSMQVWPDAITGLREIKRVLKPGGRLVRGFTRHSGQLQQGLTQTLAAAEFAGAPVVNDAHTGDFCAVAVKP